MADFGPQIADQVVEACKAGVDETNEALSRALDSAIELSIGEAASFDAASLDAGFQAAGLVVAMKVNAQAALFVVPESSGFLPDWYKEPDATGESKLATLGQELGMLMLPEEFMALDFQVGHVVSIAESLDGAKLAGDAHQVEINLSGGGNSAKALLIWPANEPDNAFSPAEETPEPAAAIAPEPVVAAAPIAAASSQAVPAAVAARGGNRSVDALPDYSRSLLKIEVPVRVVLASKKMTVNDITDIGIGSIIQFDKSCEEPLNIEVGEQCVAEGEAVKVGEKFGLRVTRIAMPEERYISVRGNRRVM